jgi:hypothetical protein
MSTTCPCSGVARTEPGLDFIHEVQVSAVGTSAEFGNLQGGLGRIELLIDVLNLLNDTAESLATETQMTETVFSATFGEPVSFVDPRRAMIGVRLNLGR